ncbi:Tetratricopeptide repeat protein [Gammaproteobacteria bacterium]
MKLLLYYEVRVLSYVGMFWSTGYWMKKFYETNLRIVILIFTLTNVVWAEDPEVIPTTPAEKVSAEEPQIPTDPPPPFPAQGEPVYDVLVGEIAGQRGQFSLSADHYVRAARQSRDPSVAERATKVSALANEVKNALESVQLWVDLKPESKDAYQAFAVLLLRVGDFPGATAKLETLLTLFDSRKPEDSYGTVATLLGREPNREAALSIMGKLVDRSNKQRPEALLAMSRLALDAKRPVLALESLDKALTIRSGWMDAILLRARVLQIQNIEDSRAYLAGFLKSHPNDIPLRLAYAHILLDTKKFDQARAQYFILSQQKSNDSEINSEILFVLGALYLEAKQEYNAKRQFLRLLKSGQKTEVANFYLGQISEMQKRPTEALSWYQAVKEGDHALDAQIRAAAILVGKGNLAAARDCLHSVEPKDTAQVIRLILVENEFLRDVGHFEESLDLLSRAISEVPGNVDFLYARAVTADKLNRLSIMEEDLSAILKIDPNHVQALNMFGYVLADRVSRLQESLGYIQRALALRPNDFYILDSMGWLQYRMGKNAEAITYLKRALGTKADPEVAAHLGEVLWSTGDRRGARKVWLRALKTAPKAKILLDTMKRFGEKVY